MDLNGTMLHIMIHFSILFRNHATHMNTTKWCLNVSYFHPVIYYTSNMYSSHYLWHFDQCVDGADEVRDGDASEMDKRKVSFARSRPTSFVAVFYLYPMPHDLLCIQPLSVTPLLLVLWFIDWQAGQSMQFDWSMKAMVWKWGGEGLEWHFVYLGACWWQRTVAWGQINGHLFNG